MFMFAIRYLGCGQNPLICRKFPSREEAIAEFSIEVQILQEERVPFWGMVAQVNDTGKRRAYVNSIPPKVGFEQFADVARKLFPGCVPEDKTYLDTAHFIAYKGDGTGYVLQYQEDYGDTIWGDGWRRAGLSLAECLYN